MSTYPLTQSADMKALAKSTVEVSRAPLATLPLKRKADALDDINAANKNAKRPPLESAFAALLTAAGIPDCDDSDSGTESDPEALHICEGKECTHRGCNGH